MATIEEKEIISHDEANAKLRVRVRIDGVDYHRKCGNAHSTIPAEQNAVLDDVAENLRMQVEERNVIAATVDLASGIGNWAARPEGKEKQDIAKFAMREVIRLAREGKVLQADGRTRPEAARQYMSTRRLKDKIWDELAYLSHLDRALYLDLEGPGPDTVYGELNGFMNDLEAAKADWKGVIDFMANCTNPLEPKD